MRPAPCSSDAVEPTTAPPAPSVLTEYAPKPRERYGLHLLLFLLTFASGTPKAAC